jgi:asparagine synthase (glutamine-hydrolysing)
MDKMGFVAPEEVWMGGELRPFVLDIIGSGSFKNRKYWDAAGVAEEYRLFLEKKHPYSPEIWRFVCTELWLRMFFDNPSSASVRT